MRRPCDYFHTKVYYDREQAGAKPARARKVADLFGRRGVAPLPPKLARARPAARC